MDTHLHTHVRTYRKRDVGSCWTYRTTSGRLHQTLQPHKIPIRRSHQRVQRSGLLPGWRPSHFRTREFVWAINRFYKGGTVGVEYCPSGCQANGATTSGEVTRYYDIKCSSSSSPPPPPPLLSSPLDNGPCSRPSERYWANRARWIVKRSRWETDPKALTCTIMLKFLAFDAQIVAELALDKYTQRWTGGPGPNSLPINAPRG